MLNLGYGRNKCALFDIFHTGMKHELYYTHAAIQRFVLFVTFISLFVLHAY